MKVAVASVCSLPTDEQGSGHITFSGDAFCARYLDMVLNMLIYWPLSELNYCPYMVKERKKNYAGSENTPHIN
eukprot:277264-Pelagomonas_calceolata.AAC.1